MIRSTMRSQRAAWVLVLVVGVAAGCSGPRLVDGTDLLPVSGSGSDDLPPPVVRPVGSGGYTPPAPTTYPTPTVSPAPTAYPTPTGYQATPPAPMATPMPQETVPPSWSTPAPVSQPMYQPAGGTRAVRPPQPPPPSYAPGTATRYYAPGATTTAVPLANRGWSGCGLPCQDGVSKWHARGVIGWPFFEGVDAPEPCSYWGVDLGRTHCGCWGYDLYYRMAGCQYERTETDAAGAVIGRSEDGGYQHHFGLKFTYERSFGNSKFYGWGGVGGGYYISDGFWDESEGWEVYGELGIGYVINQTWRVRVGVNAHGFDDEATRKSAANSGQARWMWLIAPVVQVEVNF